MDQRRIALENEYLHHAVRTSDINQHLPTLRALAAQCNSVTELGTRGVDGSTVAFAASGVPRLDCYDVDDCSERIRRLGELAAPTTRIVFHRADVLHVELEPTDLLFIDTRHTYAQLSAELALHGDKALRWIVLHDTTTFGDRGEDGQAPGLWLAVEQLVQAGVWRVAVRYTHNNGLTVLERC